MGYRPPKGVRPPQLEGKRTGRPKGSQNHASAWRDAVWGYEHRNEDRGDPPTAGAWLWWTFASYFPDEVREFLEADGHLPRRQRPTGLEGLLEDMRWVYGHRES